MSAQAPAATDLDSLLASIPVLPVVTIADAGRAADLAHALLAGGITAVEIALRTPAALEAIRRIAQAVPACRVGAGTIRRPEDMARAAEAGATFGLSPGSTPDLLAAGRGAGLIYIPAIATGSEVLSALDHGYRAVKFYPAEQAGGAATLKSFQGPFADVTFCPSGGISQGTLGAYLALPNVASVGGSWIATGDDIARGDWAAITAKARAAADLAASLGRGP